MVLRGPDRLLPLLTTDAAELRLLEILATSSALAERLPSPAARAIAVSAETDSRDVRPRRA